MQELSPAHAAHNSSDQRTQNDSFNSRDHLEMPAATADQLRSECGVSASEFDGIRPKRPRSARRSETSQIAEPLDFQQAKNPTGDPQFLQIVANTGWSGRGKPEPK